MKTRPYCAEYIRIGAVKRSFCGEWLERNSCVRTLMSACHLYGIFTHNATVRKVAPKDGGSEKSAEVQMGLTKAILARAAGLAVVMLGVTSLSASVELTTSPTQLTLATDEAVELLVTVENKKKTTATGIHLQTHHREDIRVMVKAGPTPGTDLAPGASVSWLVEIRRGSSGRRLTPLLVRLRYSQRPEENEPSVGRELVTTVKIEGADEQPLTALAGLELRSSLDTLKDRRRGNTVHLVISNKSGELLSVESIRVRAPYFLCVEKKANRRASGGAREPCNLEEKITPPLVIPPHSSKVVSYVLSASAVEPGKHSLHWEADFAWAEGPRRRRGTLVAQKDLQFGVLGESEFVTGLKIPSLFLLPGFLFLFTLRSLRKWVHPRVEKAVDFTAVEVLFVAATLSVGAAIAYPWITLRFFGDPRDFIVLAGFVDITNLWIASVGLGIAAWILWYGGRSVLKRIGQAIRLARERASKPQTGDTPIAVLMKLQRAGRKDPSFEEVEFQGEGGTKKSRLLVLFEIGDWLWLAPGIEVSGGVPESRDRVKSAIDEGITALIESLGKLHNRLTLKWAGEAAMITGPLKLAASHRGITRGGKRRRLARVIDAE